jgi:hypothetical protein
MGREPEGKKKKIFNRGICEMRERKTSGRRIPQLAAALTGTAPPLMSEIMKRLPLRTLLRDPLRVKRITKGGVVVRITDNGVPLWDLHPVSEETVDKAKRDRKIDEILNEVLREKPSRISLSKILDDSRR